MSELDIVKKPHKKSTYTIKDIEDLVKCTEDPLYFMQNFMKIQHPMKGAIQYVPYPFQLRLINAFHNHRFSIGLTARQMGKCLFYNSLITKSNKKVEVGSLIPQGFKGRLVSKLENILVNLADEK